MGIWWSAFGALTFAVTEGAQLTAAGRQYLPRALMVARAPGSAEGVALMRVLFNFTMLASATGAAGGAW